MKALLIPVKDLTKAKQRLAPWFSQSDRTAIAEAMFDDFCAAVEPARGMDRIFLISSYEPAIERARHFGWEVLRENSQESESASVDAASRICAERGVTALARVPIDLPLIRAEDIEAIFAQARPAPSMLIVPSRCGTGTNTLLRIPPALFPSHFGPNSYPKHLHEAERCGAECVILRNERLELDVDDWDDLQALATRDDLPASTGRWLERAGIRASAPRTNPPVDPREIIQRNGA
ncbi:MAG: 2-phospho-L-lactate guanylyltransferase [Candidatus Acidiferrales bacterium]